MNRRDCFASFSTAVLCLHPVFQPTNANANANASGTVSAAQLLAQGGCAVLLRHTQTDPGIGDPAGFKLDVCSSQRNLNALGRQQAVQIGRWFASGQLLPRAVRTSAWCRCQDTARLAFGESVAVWPALNSFFSEADSPKQAAQTAALQAALAQIPPGVFEVWVTHQVNITALTGDVPRMGEARVVQPQVQGKMRVLPLSFF